MTHTLILWCALVVLAGCAAPPAPPTVLTSPPVPIAPDPTLLPAPPAARAALPDYFRQVQALIRGNMRYHPVSTSSANPAVLLEVRLDAGFNVRAVRVVTPSGVPAFDQAVLRAVRQARRYPTLPAGLDPAPFLTHQIRYRLHESP